MPSVPLNEKEVAVIRQILTALAITKDGKLVLRDETKSRPSIVKVAQLEILNSIARKIKLKGIILPDVDITIPDTD